MSDHKYPAVTVDIIIFSLIEKDLKVLLIQRKNPPFQDMWAIPGGFIDCNEDLIDAAKRELEEETGVKDIFLEQLHTFGKPDRDPRGRTVSIAYFAVANSSKLDIKASDDAKDARWFDVKTLPDLAFDHNDIVSCALEKLRMKIENTPLVRELLPKDFTLEELHKLYESLLDREIDFGRFRCEILQMDFIEKISSSTYKFKKNTYFSSKFY